MIAVLIHLSTRGDYKWQGIFTFGAAIGLALSTKSSGIALSGIAVLALAGLWIKDFFFPTSGFQLQDQSIRRGRNLSELLAILLIIGFVAIAGGGYWYIRNFLFTGTPLYPVGITILGKTIFPGVSISQAIYENTNILPQLKTCHLVLGLFMIGPRE